MLHSRTNLAVFLLVILAFFASAAPGDMIFVDTDAYSNMQDAIDAADDGDKIIVHTGRYYENIVFRGGAEQGYMKI